MLIKMKPESVREYFGVFLKENLTDEQIDEILKPLCKYMEVVANECAKYIVRETILQEIKSLFNNELSNSITSLEVLRDKLDKVK